MSKIGIKAKLYYNTGTYGSPTWTAINLVGDLQVNFSWDEGEGTTRASRVKQFANSVANLELTGTIRTEPADTAYVALRNAAISDIAKDFLVLNGANNEADTDGFRFDGKVGGWGEDQGRGVAPLFKTFTIKPSVSANNPKHVVVDDEGAMSFEDIGDQT